MQEDKVGITGGSYGGYASAWGATYYSDRFAASVMFVGISNKLSKVGTTDIPDEEFYVQYFQEPGRAEAEIERSVRDWLLGFYWCASGDVLEAWIGFRWKIIRQVQLIGGFRSTRYEGVGVDLRPGPDQQILEVDRSATYEGFYGGFRFMLF